MKNITSLPELASRLTGRRYFQTSQFNSAVETYLPTPDAALVEVRKALQLDQPDTDVHVVAMTNLMIAHSTIAKFVGLDVSSVLMATMPANSYLGDRFNLGESGQSDPQVIYKPSVFPFPCVFELADETDGVLTLVSKDVPGTTFTAEEYGEDGKYRVRWPSVLGVVGDLVPGGGGTPTDQLMLSPTHYPFSSCLAFVKTNSAVSTLVAAAGAEQAFGLLPCDSEKMAALAASLVLATY